MARTRVDETREGVDLTNLDQPLFEGAGATKREHIDYLDGVADRILPALRDRPLSVIRTTRGQAPFFQKNLPDYTPEWVARVSVWAEASHRDVSYALCNDRRTLLWFGNQRAVEFHPALAFADRLEHITHLVLDLDPPGDDFRAAVAAARLVREALAGVGLSGALKTSGAKGLHVFVPIIATTSPQDAAAATRALAQRAEQLDPAIATTAFIKEDREGKVFVDATRTGGATVVAAYSPRARAGVPVSYPVDWDDLDDISPRDFTIKTAVALLDDVDPWAEAMPEDQELPADLLAEGHEIPIPRVAAMHEGKRRRAKERNA
ncbi:MAG TPA: non-homologous end-joining DNA ligase [Ilumatobacter sp.]|nr:non-homologous end-joining DNA ligase [Ilumatobacter sp.]